MTLEMDKEKDFRGVKWRACSMRGTDSILRIFFLFAACFVVVRTKGGREIFHRTLPSKGGRSLFFSSSLLLFSRHALHKQRKQKKNWAFGLQKKNIQREGRVCVSDPLFSSFCVAERKEREREREGKDNRERAHRGARRERERERERESRK